MFGLKNNKVFVHIEQVGKPTVLSEEENTRMESATLRIQAHAGPDQAMAMTLAGLTDVAERFRSLHAMMPEPCDCAAIKLAGIILRHTAQINEEMIEAIKH